MTQERLGMRSIREALRLKMVLHRTDTEVAGSVRCARSTIGQYVRRAEAAGLTAWPALEKLGDRELEEKLYPRSAGAAANAFVRNRPLPEWSDVHAEMKRRGNEKLTLSLLWQEYRAEHANGYWQTQFFEYYARWKKNSPSRWGKNTAQEKKRSSITATELRSSTQGRARRNRDHARHDGSVVEKGYLSLMGTPPTAQKR